MVAGKFRSGHHRKVQRRVPGGRTVQRYDERAPKAPHCAGCGAQLPGIGRMSNVEAKTAAKSAKRVERPYGGMLCSACMRRRLIAQARG